MYFLVSITVWFVFVAAYSYAYDLSGVGSLRDFSHEGILLLSNPTLWSMLPVCVFTPLLADWAYAYARRFWWPTLLDVVQEWDRCGDKQERETGGGGPSVTLFYVAWPVVLVFEVGHKRLYMGFISWAMCV